MKNVMDLRVFDQNWTPIIWKTRPPGEIVKINLWICFCELQLDPRPMNSSSWNSRSLPTLFVVLLVLAGVIEPTGCLWRWNFPQLAPLQDWSGWHWLGFLDGMLWWLPQTALLAAVSIFSDFETGEGAEYLQKEFACAVPCAQLCAEILLKWEMLQDISCWRRCESCESCESWWQWDSWVDSVHVLWTCLASNRKDAHSTSPPSGYLGWYQRSSINWVWYLSF